MLDMSRENGDSPAGALARERPQGALGSLCSYAAKPSCRYNVTVARTKTTVYLDPEVLRATRVSAARKGRRDSDIVEEALREYLGFAVIDRIRARSDLTGDEALELATEEVRAHRREQRASER